jgi:hypothetical protein
MKKKKLKWYIILLIICTVAISIYFFANKENPGIEGLPTEVSKYIKTKDLEELEEQDYKINYGLTPPNIEGTYLTNSLVIDYDKNNSNAIGSPRLDRQERFFDQTSDNKITKESVTVESNETRVGEVGYLSGDDNCFTFFDIGTTNRDYGCVVTSAEIVSGCLDAENNIEDYKIAILMLEHNSKILCEYLPKVFNKTPPVLPGNIRLISETDGLAERED